MNIEPGLSGHVFYYAPYPSFSPRSSYFLAIWFGFRYLSIEGKLFEELISVIRSPMILLCWPILI